MTSPSRMGPCRCTRGVESVNAAASAPASIRRYSTLLVVVLVFTTITCAYYVGRAFATSAPYGTAAPVLIADSLPGSIVAVTPLTAVAPEIRDVSAAASRIVYRSTGSTGAGLVPVSGAFFVPSGTAPPGGWPVVAIGHDGAGIDTGCAPSSTTTLLGLAPLVATLLRGGHAVTVTDYRGLGIAGSRHDYLDIAGAGRSIIDSVRALRGAYPDVSARWVAFGRAQGGGAVWTADQQAAVYAPDLELVGAIAVSPLTDATPLVDEAVKGTLNPAQRTALLWSLASLASDSSGLNLDDYRRGVAAAQWDSLTACSGAQVHDANSAAKDIGPFDLSPATPEAANRLRDLMRGYAVTDAPLSAPLSVVYAAGDGLTEPRWTGEAITRACGSGGTVEWHNRFARPNRDTTRNVEIAWLADRFAGRPAGNDCATAAMSSAGAGVVISVEDIPDVGLPVGARGARILYGSTEGDTGASTVVSGTVYTPGGTPPPGGFPVIAFAHGTVGVQEACGPSLPANLPFQTPIAAALLSIGYAVSFADYQGLGAPGIHPYLDARTAGLNVIDSVRALRATYPDVSRRWAALGHSQGAAAAWSVGEQAASYAPDLDLVGTVALAPPADLSGIVDKAANGQLTREQIPGVQAIVYSMARIDPTLNTDDYRRGSAVTNWELLASCTAPTSERDAAVAQLQQSEVAPATPEAAARLKKLLERWSLPQRQSSAPLSVVYGAEDLYIDNRWTTDAISRACRLGNLMSIRLEPNSGHADLNWLSEIYWLRDRFENKPLINDCPKSPN